MNDKGVAVFSINAYKYFIVVFTSVWFAGITATYSLKPNCLLNIENALFDFYTTQKPNPYNPNVPVKIIEIDEASLKQHGQWPWPRHLIAKLVETLAQYQAAVIAFDIFFPEPDRTSLSKLPATITQIAPLLSATQNTLLQPLLKSQLPDNDDLLANAIRKANNVVLGFVPSNEVNQRPAQHSPAIAEKTGYQLPNFAGAISSLPRLQMAARSTGTIFSMVHSDNVMRSVPLFVSIDKTILPSLDLEAVRLYLGDPQARYTIRAPDASTNGSWITQLGQKIIPTNSYSEVRLYDSNSRTARYISAGELLEGGVDPEDIRGQIVLIGVSAAGLYDLHQTPLNAAMPGVEVHAQIIEQILNDVYLRQPAWLGYLELAITLVIGLGFALLFFTQDHALLRAMTIFLTVSTVLAAGSWWLFSQHQLLLNAAFPIIAWLLILITLGVTSYWALMREKQYIRNQFCRYVSPELVDYLMQYPGAIQLDGKEQPDRSILFCDIRSFTTLSESLYHTDLVKFLNRFHDPMTKVILAHKGTIDKYIGDCIMAFWNAPCKNDSHAQDACRAALDMQKRLAQLNRDNAWQFHDKKTVRVGIGINTGSCQVGNLGSEFRFDYTIVGDEVNVAQRLEGLTKKYGVTILISDSTRTQCRNFAVLRLGKVLVKGKKKDLDIWTVVGTPDEAKTPYFETHRQLHELMLEAYTNQHWEAARQHCAALLKLETTSLWDIQPYYEKFMLAQIDRYQKTPPPPDWRGVYDAEASH